MKIFKNVLLLFLLFVLGGVVGLAARAQIDNQVRMESAFSLFPKFVQKWRYELRAYRVRRHIGPERLEEMKADLAQGQGLSFKYEDYARADAGLMFLEQIESGDQNTFNEVREDILAAFLELYEAEAYQGFIEGDQADLIVQILKAQSKMEQL